MVPIEEEEPEGEQEVCEVTLEEEGKSSLFSPYTTIICSLTTLCIKPEINLNFGQKKEKTKKRRRRRKVKKKRRKGKRRKLKKVSSVKFSWLQRLGRADPQTEIKWSITFLC